MKKGIKKIKIEWLKDQKPNFSQIHENGLEYSLCSEDYKQVCKFVWCKDFFQDAYCAYINKCQKEIYGFRYSYEKDIPLSMDKIRILLANKQETNLQAKLKKAVFFINQVEKELGIKNTTTLFECSSKPKNYPNKIYLIEGDKRWLWSPTMLSLYTLLIRVGCKHMKKHGNWKNTCELMMMQKIKEYQKNDHQLLKTSLRGIKHIVKYGDRKVFGRSLFKNYPKDIGTSTLHNNTGICGFSKKYTSSIFPHWHNVDMEDKPETFIS